MQVKWKGVWKIAIFRQMSGFISNDTRHGQIWHRVDVHEVVAWAEFDL